MIEFVLGFLLSWPALFVLIGLGILLEYNEHHKFALVIGIGAAVTAFMFFGLSLASLAYYAIGYVVIGLVWSFWRYHRFMDKSIERIKATNYDNRYGQNAVAQKKEDVDGLSATRNLGKVTSWILVWPFSAVESILGDIINIVQTAITKWFKGVYGRIHNRAYEQLGVAKS